MAPPKKDGPALWVDYFGPYFGDQAENDRLAWWVSDARGDRNMVTAYFNDAATLINVEATPIGTDFTVHAGGGDDQVFAGFGNDRLHGEAGRDRLSGGWGDDALYGGADDDRLQGNDGDDHLWGGSGNDTFVFLFRPGLISLGIDTIHDFVAGEDALRVSSKPVFQNFVDHPGNFANYAETSVAPGTDLATIEATADALYASSSWYKFVFVADGTDGYLFVDVSDDPRAMITLKGVGSVEEFSYQYLV
jgi:Ca2+-binding RTX toxin-like protein